MMSLQGVAHFSIGVKDLDRSLAFYTDVVGCRLIARAGPLRFAFIDAGGMCVILVETRDLPADKNGDQNGVHHAFIVRAGTLDSSVSHLQNQGVEVFFREDRQGGVVNGPRAYFRDPDGNVLEFIELTSYNTNVAPR